jgi:hypothetical protein
MEKGDVQERYGDKGKSVAYAIATQQAHSQGKTPKKKGGYGTPEGRREAKMKYPSPKEYRKTASRLQRVIEKVASLAGQDLRTPFTGMNTNFPTADSTAFAANSLNQSKAVASPKPFKTPTIQSQAPTTGKAGTLPKIGAAMNEYTQDPLVQYLRKQAAKLEDNETDMETGQEEMSLKREDPEPCPGTVTDALNAHKKYLKDLFDHHAIAEPKYTEKEL